MAVPGPTPTREPVGSYSSLITDSDVTTSDVTTSDVTTYFLYDGARPDCEVDAESGSVTAINTFGADGLVSRYSGGSSAFYTFDASGNVAQRLNSSAAVSSSDLYDAYGSQQSTASTPDVFGYGGQWGYYTDSETGLVLCTHRYYDPGTGRWLTRDPMHHIGGIDLYG